MDPAIEEAIKLETGDSPPYTQDLLSSVGYLEVVHARDIEALRDCPNVEVLSLIGCDPVDLRVLSGLERLSSLVVQVSNLGSIAGVAQLPSLYKIELTASLVEDLAELQSCRGLRYVKLQGNPLTESSYREVISSLRAEGVRVAFPDEREWRINGLLREAGFLYGYYRAHDGYRLCRPGLRLTDHPEMNHPIVDPGRLEEIIATNPAALPELFRRMDLMPRTLGP